MYQVVQVNCPVPVHPPSETGPPIRPPSETRPPSLVSTRVDGLRSSYPGECDGSGRPDPTLPGGKGCPL